MSSDVFIWNIFLCGECLKYVRKNCFILQYMSEEVCAICTQNVVQISTFLCRHLPQEEFAKVNVAAVQSRL